MNWKGFLKPSKVKIILTILIAIPSIFVAFSLGLFPLLGPVYYFSGILSVLFFDLLGFSTSGIIGILFAILSYLFAVFYWYLLSCLIVWIYNKIKKK